jgi:hypothetical protein
MNKFAKFGDIHIEGLDELCKAFVDLGEEALPILLEVSNEAGNVVLEKARELAPEKSGNLKKKLKLGKGKISKKYPYRVFSKVSFTKGAAYGVPVELGHRLVYMGRETDKQVPPRPFLRPAADACRTQVQDMLINAMNKALEQMGGEK